MLFPSRNWLRSLSELDAMQREADDNRDQAMREFFAKGSITTSYRTKEPDHDNNQHLPARRD